MIPALLWLNVCASRTDLFKGRQSRVYSVGHSSFIPFSFQWPEQDVEETNAMSGEERLRLVGIVD